MKTKELKKINILINGDETDRNEIIYNNVITNANMTQDEQIKYLKNRAATLELELKNRRLTALLTLISIIGISFGIVLLVQDLYLLGSLFIVVTFIGVIVRFHLMYKTMIEHTKSKEFEKVDNLKKMLEERLK